MNTPRFIYELKNPYIFSNLVNLKCKLSKVPFRCIYLPKQGIFKLNFEGESRYASVNSRVLTYMRGFRYRASYIKNTYFLEEIEFKDGDLVVDCGANMGDLEYYLRGNLPNVNYIGYEPNPLDFKCLELNVGKMKSKNIGLWNISSELEFFVNDRHASSSFIRPPSFTNIIKIPARTLSDELPNTKIKLLKLEAEGGEPEVLEGARGILRNIDFISVDVGPERGVKEDETKEMVKEILLTNHFYIVKESKFHRKIILFKNILDFNS